MPVARFAIQRENRRGAHTAGTTEREEFPVRVVGTDVEVEIE